MKSYFSPAYKLSAEENPFDLLGLSIEYLPGDNSVIIDQDAEELFE